MKEQESNQSAGTTANLGVETYGIDEPVVGCVPELGPERWTHESIVLHQPKCRAACLHLRIDFFDVLVNVVDTGRLRDYRVRHRSI